jgi:hypothetical protein
VTETGLEGVSTTDFNDPPFKLIREILQLQVMGVVALRHVAGRVPIDGTDKYVIFETSLGLLVLEMV